EAKNRHQEAEEIVISFENAALAEGKNLDSDLAPEVALDEAFEGSSIWSSRLRARTAALWLIWFCINLSYYGAFIWIPLLLVADGFALVRSFISTLFITLALQPGYAAAAWLIAVWGLRVPLAVFLVGSAASAGSFRLSDSQVSIIIAGCFLSFLNRS